MRTTPHLAQLTPVVAARWRFALRVRITKATQAGDGYCAAVATVALWRVNLLLTERAAVDAVVVGVRVGVRTRSVNWGLLRCDWLVCVT